MDAFAEVIDRTTTEELRARGSWKWTAGGPGVIGAFIAEMDFGVAPPVEAALLDAIRRADFGYLTERAVAEMGDACAGWQRDRYGWDVDPARVRPLPDVISGLTAAITVFSRPGSPVILPTPAYMPFLTYPRSAGREIIQVPMIRHGGRYVLDLDGIDAAFKRGGHLLVLCNPCNPVGRVYSAGELLAVAEVVEANGGRVFADEIHAPLIYPGHAHVPYASVSPAAAAHAVTGVAASKGWNLPGLKCAQLLLTNDADAAVWAERGFTFEHGASTPGVWATIAAYRDGGPWLDDVVRYLDRNRALLAELLAEQLPQAGFLPPEGTYLAWLDCRGLDYRALDHRAPDYPAPDHRAPDNRVPDDRALDDRALAAGRGHPGERPGQAAGEPSPADFFLAKAQVMLTDGAACGAGGGGHVRLNFATPRPVLTEIVRRMAAATAR